MEQRSKVLVVEDDAGIRQSLYETLTALGFVIGEAGNGEEALLRLRMIDYDAVLLDINMPGITGIEVCREVRASSTIPIVIMSAGEESKAEALEAGANNYLKKPFSVSQVFACVDSNLAEAG